MIKRTIMSKKTLRDYAGLGQWLKQLREDLGYSQTEIAKALGIYNSRLCQIEADGSIRLHHLVRLSTIYDFNLDEVRRLFQ